MTSDQLDTHYEAILDEEPETRAPVYVDVIARTHDRQPIVPAQWRPSNLPATLRRHLGLGLHKAGYHGARVPLVYIPYSCWYSLIGLGRLIRNQIAWWWLMEQHSTRQAAATANDGAEWARLHAIAVNTRRWRGMVLAAELVALLIAWPLLYVLGTWWLYALLGMVTVPLLAHYGRPVDKPIVTPAVVSPRFRTITADVVLRAYYAAGLGNPDKRDQAIKFGSRMERDGGGGRVVIDLPYGRKFAEVIKAREAIASGLDVTVNQVFLTRDKTSERRHLLFVADVDPLSIPAGKTDMLDLKPRNIWRPAKLGRDERGALVTLNLLWNSVLIGAMPRRGKTFFVRLILLYAAMDPWVKILGADGKKSSDYDKFRLVAHRWVVGDAPNPRDSDPVGNLVDMLDEVLAHIAKVNDVLSSLPVDMCPEGKLTEALARDPRFPDLRVWVLVGEEFQVYFETEDQETNKQIASKWGRIMAQGPSAGVILLDSSQKPGGVGAGDVGRLFNRFRDNHQVRFALRCGNRLVSEAVLGGDAYAEGYDASALPIGDGTNGTNDYRGVGILYGASDNTPTVRTYLADHADAERILIAARALRERYGTLSGLAAGENIVRDLRDVLRDVDSVFYAGEAWISWPQLAQRLAEQIPEHYAGTTADAISAQVRALGADGKKGRDRFDEGRSVQGVPRERVGLAIKRREIEAGR